MSISETQKPVQELLNDLSDKVNLFLGENYIVDIQKKSGLSQPVISAIKRKRAEGMSLKNFVQIANAIGYRVTEIKLEKIED
jgi:hypothetical protein